VSILLSRRLEYGKDCSSRLEPFHGYVGTLLRFQSRLQVEPEEGYFRAIAAELGITDILNFVGRVPHAQMQQLYATYDFFVLPSLHDSGAQVIGEAMAHRVPVVCFDLGGSGVRSTRVAAWWFRLRQRAAQLSNKT
jgi:glycosyltransferase involved in cell wall biosynthesis